MTITGVISALIFGAIIGALGRLLVPGRQSMPLWLTVVVGIIAAFAGTGLAKLFRVSTVGFNFWEFLFQVGVAIVAVLILSALWPRGHREV